MQSYVINIYRVGGEDHPDEVIGSFTDSVNGSERRFASLAELHNLVDGVVRTRAVSDRKSVVRGK